MKLQKQPLIVCKRSRYKKLADLYQINIVR